MDQPPRSLSSAESRLGRSEVTPGASRLVVVGKWKARQILRDQGAGRDPRAQEEVLCPSSQCESGGLREGLAPSPGSHRSRSVQEGAGRGTSSKKLP